jgi:hypothetical protein
MALATRLLTSSTVVMIVAWNVETSPLLNLMAISAVPHESYPSSVAMRSTCQPQKGANGQANTTPTKVNH